MNRQLRAVTGLAFGLVVVCATATEAADYRIRTFKRIEVTDKFWSEGADFGDFNRDGKMDVASGPFWYAGPDFKQRHAFRPAAQSFKLKKNDGTEVTLEGYEGGLGKKNAYSDNFFTFVYDFNADGWADIMVIGLPNTDASWYENPKGKAGDWLRHKVFDVVDNESPDFADITGDGKPEIICNRDGYLGYAQADWNDAAKPWTWHAISPKGSWHKYTHGIGIGDVNGDGRMDLLEKDGWWEQPAALAGDTVWTKHAFSFGKGGCQMYAYDVNGDGLPDVITSIEAHGFGVAWFEQVKKDGESTFIQHLIAGSKPEDTKYGVRFSQPHAIALYDMDGDGFTDIVVGKRFWAHGPGGDPEPNAPAVVYWFRLVRDPATKQAEFIPHLIDDNSGVGTQVVAGDLNGDKLGDVVVGNKKGTFVFLQEAKKASKTDWEGVQPKPVSAAAK